MSKGVKGLVEEKKEYYYSIGEVSRICNVSKKTLRFYDKIGLISPDKVSDDNNYRYYTRKTLLSVPIIKYYKQMGFKLEEMRELLEGTTYSVFEKQFRRKIDELKELEKQVFQSYTSVKDWYDLILEAELVIDNKVTEVSVKYMENGEYCFLEQDFEFNYMESVINIDFTNFIESINNAITGPVMINFPSLKERMEGSTKKVRMVQRAICPLEDQNTIRLGGHMVASCYHIGSHDNLGETYEKIIRWAECHGYQCGEESLERYVTDYWTTKNPDQFVTEIMIKVSKI